MQLRLPPFCFGLGLGLGLGLRLGLVIRHVFSTFLYGNRVCNYFLYTNNKLVIANNRACARIRIRTYCTSYYQPWLTPALTWNHTPQMWGFVTSFSTQIVVQKVRAYCKQWQAGGNEAVRTCPCFALPFSVCLQIESYSEHLLVHVPCTSICQFLVQIFQCGMLPNYMQSACFSLHVVHMLQSPYSPHASVSRQFTCFSLHAVCILQSPCSSHASVSM